MEKIKLNYIVIPLFVFLVALVGSSITNRGMDWYKTIELPDWTPSGAVIGIAWTIIFVLTAISALIFWNKFPRGKRFNCISLIFIINALLNVLWSYLFFGQHLIGWAVWGAGLLGLSVIFLIAFIRPVSRLASILLFPYAIWVIFATYLTYTVWNLNILK